MRSLWSTPQLSATSRATVQRLLAHEAGRVLLQPCGEVVTGRRAVVDTASQWQMLSVGSLAACAADLDAIGWSSGASLSGR